MRIRVIAVASIVAVASCSGAGPNRSAEPAATSAPTRASSAPAAPTPGPTEPYAIVPGPMQPGRYLQTGISPHVSFVLSTDWQAYFADADGVYLGYLNGVELGVNRPEQVVDPVSNRAEDSPDDLAAWLAANPTFDAVERTAVEMDGRRATRIDGAATRAQDLFAYASGNFHTQTGLRYRFYVIRLDGPDLVILLLGPRDEFEAASSALDAIVDSVRIGGT